MGPLFTSSPHTTTADDATTTNASRGQEAHHRRCGEEGPVEPDEGGGGLGLPTAFLGIGGAVGDVVVADVGLYYNNNNEN